MPSPPLKKSIFACKTPRGAQWFPACMIPNGSMPSCANMTSRRAEQETRSSPQRRDGSQRREMHMSETDAVASAEAPRTRASLAADLRALGVMAGETILVQSSLRALGWVCGRPAAMVPALRGTFGPGGTLGLPTRTLDL